MLLGVLLRFSLDSIARFLFFQMSRHVVQQVAVVAYVYTTVTLVLADVLVAPDVRFHGIAAGHCLQAIWPCYMYRSCDRLVHVLVFDDVVVVVVAVALPGHVVVVMVASCQDEVPFRGD